MTKVNDDGDDEVFLTSCDLTVKSEVPLTQMKGCVLKTTPVEDGTEESPSERRIFLWKKYLCCKPCAKIIKDNMWSLAVRCANIAPNACFANQCCVFLDMVSRHNA